VKKKGRPGTNTRAQRGREREKNKVKKKSQYRDWREHRVPRSNCFRGAVGECDGSKYVGGGAERKKRSGYRKARPGGIFWIFIERKGGIPGEE